MDGRHDNQAFSLASYGEHCASSTMAIMHVGHWPTKTSTGIEVILWVGQLELVAMDILGQLTVANNGNQFSILVIERYLKLMRVIRNTIYTASIVTTILLDRCVMQYKFPCSLLTDSKPQSVAHFLKILYSFLAVQELTTRNDHTETDAHIMWEP